MVVNQCSNTIPAAAVLDMVWAGTTIPVSIPLTGLAVVPTYYGALDLLCTYI